MNSIDSLFDSLHCDYGLVDALVDGWIDIDYLSKRTGCSDIVQQAQSLKSKFMVSEDERYVALVNGIPDDPFDTSRDAFAIYIVCFHPTDEQEGVPKSITRQHLEVEFAKYGSIARIYSIAPRSSLSFLFIEFHDSANVASALHNLLSLTPRSFSNLSILTTASPTWQASIRVLPMSIWRERTIQYRSLLATQSSLVESARSSAYGSTKFARFSEGVILRIKGLDRRTNKRVIARMIGSVGPGDVCFVDYTRGSGVVCWSY
jgi:hypothetical protein